MIYWPGRREPEDAEAIELAFLNHCVAFGGAPFERKGCGWHPKERTLTAHRTFQIPESRASTVLPWCTEVVIRFWGLAPWTFAFS